MWWRRVQRKPLFGMVIGFAARGVYDPVSGTSCMKSPGLGRGFLFGLNVGNP